MSILDLVWLNECVRGEISDWQPQKGFSIGKSKFLTNESKQFEVCFSPGGIEARGKKSLAKLSQDASLNGSENFSMGILSKFLDSHSREQGMRERGHTHFNIFNRAFL